MGFLERTDLFLILNQYDIANYADDNTPYVLGRSIKEVVTLLEKVFEAIFQWFQDDQVEGNASKCHVLLNPDKQVHVNIDTAKLAS